jgi:hypothetical protein
MAPSGPLSPGMKGLPLTNDMCITRIALTKEKWPVKKCWVKSPISSEDCIFCATPGHPRANR